MFPKKLKSIKVNYSFKTNEKLSYYLTLKWKISNEHKSLKSMVCFKIKRKEKCCFSICQPCITFIQNHKVMRLTIGLSGHSPQKQESKLSVSLKYTIYIYNCLVKSWAIRISIKRKSQLKYFQLIFQFTHHQKRIVTAWQAACQRHCPSLIYLILIPWFLVYKKPTSQKLHLSR